ncbi:hypothetical protein CEUSTIGMA_g177.t1 [Chlamydomonas eustigma]|uniref:Uncharacterized protein n=1 Tax=Chlamydomonas eustigma TaxID=1157962 RepID=A0A250WPK5_9CHLO|nr:hypothetical protein CEUSTIGMA_g177.t1 [Chlamydomonas eustigma]|eukprot:GAX72721.1 hypothetical protein CEUSTIGMA_g177.t1 [Chlamydomonas eustigma]
MLFLQLLRKRNSNVLGPVMVEAFTAGQGLMPEVCGWCSGSRVALEVTSKKKPVVRKQPARLDAEEDSDNDTEELSMEPLTYKRASMLLDPGPYRLAKEELREGVVQKFIPPREAHDFILRAIWSPSATIFERRTNKHLLVNLDHIPATAPMPDRIASFSASMHLHDHMPIPHGALRSRLEEQCDVVMSHLRDVTKGSFRCARMDLFFKIDVENRIWLLCCNSLKLQKMPPVLSLLSRTWIEETLLPAEASFDDSQIGSSEEFLCVMTGKIFPKSQRIQVLYLLT